MAQIQIPDYVRHNLLRDEQQQNKMLQASQLKTAGLQQQALGLRNEDAMREQQDFAELRNLLSTTAPDQQERVGLEFLRARDPDKASKLEATYINRFITKARIDPKGAAAELERSTGEKVNVGNRYSEFDVGEGKKVYIDNLTGSIFEPNKAQELAALRADLAATHAKELESERQKGREALETMRQQRPDQNLSETELFQKDRKAYEEMQRMKNKYRPIGTAGGKGGGGANQELIKAVLENPEIYPQLTPTQKAAITPALHAAGFTAFGKPLSDTAIKEITQSEIALASLDELSELVKQNKEYIGPVAGTLTMLNPYSKGKQIQADIARVRQRVGKSLEGGVLRKEDELKYKAILADIQDTDPNAIYKITQLRNDVQKEIELYRKNQKASGRNVSGLGGGTGGTTKKPKILSIQRIE